MPMISSRPRTPRWRYFGALRALTGRWTTPALARRFERRGGGLMRYVVETRMGNVWEAVWSEDQEPMIFDSEEEAEVEIAETLEDLQEAYELGDMSSPMTRDEFRIVPFEDRFAALCEEYAAWCADQGLPCIDAAEHLASIEDRGQRSWLSEFIGRWEKLDG
jgi:hypothetical protein